MPVPTCSGVPAKIEVGNTVTIIEAYPQYPATLWTMKFVLSLDGQPKVITATASGTSFSITLPAKLQPGVYDFAEYVTEIATSQRTTAKTGTIEVEPDLTATVKPTLAAQTLEAIEAAILKLSVGTNQQVNFNGQQVTKKDLLALRQERTYWKAEVLREQNSTHGSRRRFPQSGRVGTRFVSDGNRNVLVSRF